MGKIGETEQNILKKIELNNSTKTATFDKTSTIFALDGFLFSRMTITVSFVRQINRTVEFGFTLKRMQNVYAECIYKKTYAERMLLIH